MNPHVGFKNAVSRHDGCAPPRERTWRWLVADRVAHHFEALDMHATRAMRSAIRGAIPVCCFGVTAQAETELQTDAALEGLAEQD